MARKKKQVHGIDPALLTGPDERKRQTLPNGSVIQGNAREIDDLLPAVTFASSWRSPEAFSRHIGKIDKSKSWTDAGWDDGDEKWTGTASMAEAVGIAQEGWDEGVEKVEEMRSYIQAANPVAPKYKKYGIAGAYPDVPRAVAGNIMNMRIPESASSKRRPVITIISNMACNWTISKEVLCNRAAAVAALIDQIESAGYACEVISSAASKGNRWDGKEDYEVCTAVVVKTCDQPVDTSRLAFGLGHSSMFRRMMFADWGAEETAKNGLGNGLGYSQKGIVLTEEERLKHIYQIPSTEVSASLFGTDEDAAKKGLPFLIRELKRQGCPPFRNAELPEITEQEKKLMKKLDPGYDPDSDFDDEDYPD